jgi:hypothetical protein
LVVEMKSDATFVGLADALEAIEVVETALQ